MKKKLVNKVGVSDITTTSFVDEMVSLISDGIARNLRKPKSGPFGWFVTKYVFERKNVILEEYGAKLCKIEPEHKVLEVGFGPGIGLEAACKYISGGSGKVYGADISDKMLKVASRRLASQIKEEKVEIVNASVDNLPFDKNSFDRVFHCNSYYFWPDLEAGCHELYRVMRPSSVMVTILNLDNLKLAEEKGFLKYGNTDPDRLMRGLENTGFKDVKMKDITEEKRIKLQAIFANINEKNN